MQCGKSVNNADKDGFVRVRKRELDKLTTEVMQLREFLPRVLNGELMEMLNKAKAAQSMSALKEQMAQEKERLQDECLHLESRLRASQGECQKERESLRAADAGRLLYRLGSACCCMLWACTAKEDNITLWLSDREKLQSFVSVATQTLESFVRSLDGDVKVQVENQDSEEHTFVLAIAGTIANIAAVTNGRDFLASHNHVLLDSLIRLLEMMKPGAFPRLKVLMLMALYNLSINVKGLKYMLKNPGLLSVALKLLDDRDWEVTLHALRLLQSLVLEDEALLVLGPAIMDPEVEVRVKKLTTSGTPCVREAAQQTLGDLQVAYKNQKCKTSKS
ncbi:hypothetical protein WMY93_022729 [Mugilogobius chulae]|uniref:Heat shock transcription factor 2 binding protein n=1 Tax=Mugilogobius chulae TaxID=88201 RepID=A0AAW0NHV8_9GOBI